MDDLSQARIELANRCTQDPLRFSIFNPAQLRVVEAFARNPKIQVNTMGNGTGKTYVLAAIMSAIQFKTENRLFHKPIFLQWPYLKDLRIVSTAENVDDLGPIQAGIKALYPRGKYQTSKGHKGYISKIVTDTSFTTDVMTYNQSVEEFAGHNKGAVFCSEPPPQGLLSEILARLRQGGPLYIEATPLDQGAHLKYNYIDPGGLFLEGVKVGNVEHVIGELHENCRDCFEGGQLSHIAIMQTIASWPAEEREARTKGSFMQQAGLIYQSYGDHNEFDFMPDYYQKHYEAGMFTLYNIVDPHDAKPPAMAWFAVFPNDSTIGIGEYPQEPFEAMPRPRVHMDEYRYMVLQAEADIGKSADVRLVDRNFGNAPKHNGDTFVEIFSKTCRRCELSNIDCTHRLYYENAPNDIPAGHMRMRTLIGNPKEGIEPKYFNMKHCRNLCLFHRRYGYKIDKNKKLMDKAELEFKDFCDLSRYGANHGFKYIEPSPDKLRLWKPRTEGRGSYRGY